MDEIVFIGPEMGEQLEPFNGIYYQVAPSRQCRAGLLDFFRVDYLTLTDALHASPVLGALLLEYLMWGFLIMVSALWWLALAIPLMLCGAEGGASASGRVPSSAVAPGHGAALGEVGFLGWLGHQGLGRLIKSERTDPAVTNL